MGLIERQKEFMRTTITIKVVQKDNNEGESGLFPSTVDINTAIENAFGEFDRIVKKYTRFSEDSELSNLNRNSEKWVQVSDEFFMLIKYMLELAEKTNGAFDPTIIDFLEVYGYDKNYDFSKLDDETKLNKHVKDLVKNRKSFKDIEMDENKLSVKLAKNQRLDLGGIGKGYAIDCAAEKLLEISENFLIDAGGDVYANGKNDKNEIWKVGLKVMDKDENIKVIGSMELNNESLASSGSWARKVKNFHHLIDPTSGKPTEKNYTTVFIRAKTALESDSWATATFVKGKEILEIMPKDFQVMFY